MLCQFNKGDRDEDPNPAGSVDLWPARFGSITFFKNDPDPDPTCNNGYLNYFHLEQNIDQNQQIQA